jgi:hypothetical protein
MFLFLLNKKPFFHTLPPFITKNKMDTELSLRTQIDEIREEYAITELTRSMKLLTVDYIQQEIAKMAALGFHYVELSDEKWL